MKRIITVLIVIVFANLVSAQNILDTPKMWRTAFVKYCSGSNPYNGTEEYTRSVKFSGDTLINSLHYRKVFSSLEEYPENWDFLGYVRETENEELLFTTDTSNQEYLFFDFNVNINDTVSYYWLSEGLDGSKSIIFDKSIVKSIDTVFIAGENRKRIGIGEDAISDYWVKGLGNIKHGMLLMSLDYMNATDIFLTCIYQSDTIIYHNDKSSNCYYYSECEGNNIVENKDNKQITSVFPNPVTETSTLKISSNYNNNTIELYDNQGKIIITTNIDKEYLIDRQDFKSGIYFYVIKHKENIIGKGKFTIQ